MKQSLYEMVKKGSKLFQHYYYDILSFYESFVNLSLSSLKLYKKILTAILNYGKILMRFFYMGLVTVITSGKGGAGKSTVSVGLGCTLAKKRKKSSLNRRRCRSSQLRCHAWRG